MMTISAYGRLVSDPRPIETRSGKLMCVARLMVNLPTRGEEDGAYFLGLVAFGAQAERLGALAKGGMVSVIGRAQLNRWESDQGPREELQVLADEVVTAKTVRPSGGRRQDAKAPARAAARADPPLPFNDEMTF
jgi:single-strand DNA-binding protein